MRYMEISPDHRDEAGYKVEDGIIVEPEVELKPYTREYNARTRPPTWEQTREARMAEEMQWASRSGPVITIRPANRNTNTNAA